ncbi:MAG TPA: hypothetical protein VE754_03500 [Actinomycetota bacterium]|jgi:hypothetical protein|nr:hypothetical protein [Actinomycetota bacterium]
MLQRILETGERALAQRTSRRSFLGKLGRAVVVLAGGPFAAAALDPERAEAYHICGHIYTTGSCPHPFRPRSRIDRYGFPVHPKWGFPVDDQGRLYASRSQRRRRICTEVVPARYPFTKPTVLQGTWSRCCGGRIRRVVDCCSRSRTRINGDASLVGYCYGGRRVFCITYRETKIPC